MHLEWLVTAAYLTLVALSTIYAAWEVVQLLLYLRGRPERLSAPPRARAATLAAPTVTVQIPLYNERFAAARVIRAVAALDYPRESLEVQVLDDSTDDTTAIAAAEVERAARLGLDIRLLHRTRRAGFKAGALADGLRSARGEFVCVFDADFLPGERFLKELLLDRPFFEDPQVGFVQARWAHANREESLFAKAQALILDRFFLVQNPTRFGHGFVIQFNGSGGVWRRAAIEDAGGWSADTLTEDLDLSYRAALRGWRGIYAEDVVVPSELPRDMLAFKRQQRRWARGSTQCARKLAARLLVANWSGRHRLAELLTLSGYTFQVAFVVNALLWPFAVLWVAPGWLLASTQVLAAPLWLVLPIGFVAAARAAGAPADRALAGQVGLAIVIGLGSSFSNSLAVAAGWLGTERGVFHRTPKLDRGDPDGGRHETYRVPIDWTLGGELLLAAHCFASAYVLAAAGRPYWAGGPLVWGGILLFTVVLQLGPWSQLRPARRVPAVDQP